METVASVSISVSLPDVSSSDECEETVGNAILATSSNTEVEIVCTASSTRRKRSAVITEWNVDVTLTVTTTTEEAEASGISVDNDDGGNIEAISTIMNAASTELVSMGSEVKSVSPR